MNVLSFTFIINLLLIFHIKSSFSIPLLRIRIKNGNIAGPTQFPWQTSITSYYKTNNTNNNDTSLIEKYCGGTVISTEWILTAAHCLEGNPINITLGFDSLDWHKPKLQIKQIEKYIINPNYESRTYRNDIALIKLIKPLKFTSNISAIQLPSKTHIDISFEGVQSTVAGWGVINSTQINYNSKNSTKSPLEWIEIKVISNNACASIYGSIVQSSTLCAQGSNGENICGSDFGSSLITRDMKGLILIGIASFSQGCDSLNQPIGFTRITSFLNWINNQTGIVI